ncbi:hypothetical protein vnz_37075 (plasmid) [Streptomyces venezuelae]|nr:hypothetical protein vnz_37075 [Streptomyces venezuelae]
MLFEPRAFENILTDVAPWLQTFCGPVETEAGGDLSFRVRDASHLGLQNVDPADAGGSVGLTYIAPELPEEALREGFAAVAAAERARGREPELDELVLVSSSADLSGLPGPHADYLEPVLRRHFERR